MKRAFGLIVLILMSCSAAHGAVLTAPIAPAAKGQVECYKPDTAAKTCLSMATYAIDSAGVIQNTALILINPDPLIVMTAVSPVVIKNGQVCGSISGQDLSAAHFTVAGQPASPEQEAKLRPLLIQAMSKFFGHDLCTTYLPDGDGFLAKGYDNGAPQPQGDQRVMWVSPAGGYHIAP